MSTAASCSKSGIECAIMIKVAEQQDLAAQGVEVPLEIGGPAPPAPAARAARRTV